MVESKSEKLLGVILSNDLTWKEHYHGENWKEEGENDIGLIPRLSQRVGIRRKISKHMSKKRLKMFFEGIFYSKLNYCLPVFFMYLGWTATGTPPPGAPPSLRRTTGRFKCHKIQ